MRQRRTFSKEFKREAVALLEDGTRTYREVAEQLGISYSQQPPSWSLSIHRESNYSRKRFLQ